MPVSVIINELTIFRFSTHFWVTIGYNYSVLSVEFYFAVHFNEGEMTKLFTFYLPALTTLGMSAHNAFEGLLATLLSLVYIINYG